MKSLQAVLLAAFCVSTGWASPPPIALPVYLEDNHAGAFYRAAQTLDLNEPCTLLHFDAHSDATGIFNSDKLREGMRRVVSREERVERLEKWRSTGAVQGFSWVEPLMPLPFADVIWVPGERLPAGEVARLEKEAVESLDGHLEAAPRKAGSFQGRWRVRDFESLQKQPPDGAPLAVSVDLDYFADGTPEEQAAAWERVWRFISGLRNVRVVFIAISRPYLADDAQAHRLVQMAMEGALSLPTSRIAFEPFAVVGNDRSERARELRQKNLPIPAYEIEKAPELLRALLLAHREKIEVRREAERWKALLAQWEEAAPQFRLTVKDAEPSADGVWRLPVGTPFTVELRAAPWYAEGFQVAWYVQLPHFASCNLIAKQADQGVFAAGAPPRPRWRDAPIAATGASISSEDLQAFFDPAGYGVVRIWARVYDNENAAIRQTPVLELRRFEGSGLKAALTEQFGLPYLYGSGVLQSGDATGPETGWGNDCANFIIHALRRQGHRIPWSNPQQFRKYLKPVASPAMLGQTAFTPEDFEAGLIVHFGSHVASLVEDRPPLGVLDENDLAAHHLEGFPEIVPLSALMKNRRGSFDILRVPAAPNPTSRVVIGGDVMLSRGIGQSILEEKNPFEAIEPLWRDADLRVVNLECIITDKGEEIPNKRYVFRAPLKAMEALVNARVSAVSVANNHAFDCGEEGFHDGVARLQKAGVTPIGIPSVGDAASLFTLPDGGKIAILAYNALEETPATRQALAHALNEARRQADWRICFVHWGEENRVQVSEAQRTLARWLVKQGADIIVGSHPHCVQPLEFYQGRAIAWSLGNLLFDGAPTLPQWNRGALLEINFTRGNPTPHVRLITVKN